MPGQDQSERQGRGEGGVLGAVGPAQQYPGGPGGLFHGGDSVGEPGTRCRTPEDFVGSTWAPSARNAVITVFSVILPKGSMRPI